MTAAEINILIRSRAKEARIIFAAVKRDLDKIAAAGANAGGVLDGLTGAGPGAAKGLKTTSAAAADLAKALSLINKSGGPAAKKILDVGAAAELAAPAVTKAAGAVDVLAASLRRQTMAAGDAAIANRTYTKSAQGMSAVGKAATKAAKSAGASTGTAATAATALGANSIVSAQKIAKMNAAMNSSAMGANSFANKWRALNGQIVSSGKFIPGTAQSLGKINSAFQKSSWGVQQYANSWGQAHSQFRQAVPAMRQVGSSMTAMNSAMNLSQWGAAGKAQMQYARDLGGTTRAYGENAYAADQAATRSSRFGSLMSGMSGRMSGFNKGLWTASDNLRKVGSQMQWTGRQLSVMFTAPTLLAVGLGTKWALDYEKAFTRLTKVYNGSMEDITATTQNGGPSFNGSKFDKFFTALSNKMGFSREEIANVGADLAQAGMEGAQLAKATQLVTEFSIVGDQDLSKSTQDLISVMAQYKLSADEMGLAIAELNAISNETPVGMADLTDGFVRTASVAREAGVDVRHLGAFIAALTPAAGTAAVSANGLKSIFTRLMTPTQDAADMLALVGINTQDVAWTSKNAVERLAELSTKFEGLSQQQKFDLAKPFAGLYQINKFVALMDDLSSAQGNYAKALAATENPAKSFATYNKELQMFLNSNPQKLKQAGQIIKNSLADAIIPLLPYIVWLAQAFAKLMNKFQQMDPAMQKFIILSLLALAAVGPLAMLVGSFAILGGVMGKSLFYIAAGFSKVGGGASKLSKLLFGVNLSFKGILKESAAFVGRFGAMLGRAGMVAVRALGAQLVRLAPFILRVVVPRVAAAAGVLAGVFTGPIGWAILGLITLISLFPKQTYEIMKSTGKFLAQPFIWGYNNIVAVFQALGRLVSRGMDKVREIMDSVNSDDGIPMLAKPFVIGVRVIGATLAALPKLVVSVFQAVVRVIQRAAQAVYEAFSYINPFAHHSPSLVENVTNGMAVVTGQFSSAADSIDASTKRAYASISRFGNATAGLNIQNAEIDRQDKVEKFQAVDPGGSALAAYDDLESQLPSLQAHLDAVNKEIDDQNALIDQLEAQVKQADKAIEGMNKTLELLRATADAVNDSLQAAQERLDYYSNAPIKGMKAMSDAIFGNEMAQKRLRLEILKMEEAGQSVDDVTDKFAKLQGQIETMSGEREGLRLDGAGSDILGTYDKMIADLNAQQGAVATDSLSPIAAAQKELERLQNEGEKLDLENALKFDPLTRQIDDMVNSTKELSFGEITAGIASNKAAVTGLTAAYDAANAAVKGQEAAIKAAEEARDLMSDNIDVEKEKLTGLEDAQKKLETAMDDVKSAMDDINTTIDKLNQKLDEQKDKAEKASAAMDEAAQAAADWENAGLGDFEVPGGSIESVLDDTDIDSLTQKLTDDVAKMFDNIDIGGAIEGFFDRIGDWFKGLPGRFVGWLGDCAVSIGNTIAGWGSSVGGWFTNLGTETGNWFGGIWDNHIWPKLQELPGKIAQFLYDLPTNLMEAGSYIAGQLAGMFVIPFIAAFNLGKAVGDYFALGGFAEDLGDLKQWASDFVWNKIIFPIGDAIDNTIDFGIRIKNYFTEGGFAMDVAEAGIAVSNWATGLANDLGRWFSETLPNAWNRFWAYMTEGGFEADAKNAADKVYNFGLDIVQGMLNGVKDKAQGTVDWVKEHMIDPFLNGFKDALGINSPSTVFADFGVNIVEGLWNGIKGKGEEFKNNLIQWVKDHVPGPVASVLGIQSPSRVMMGMGVNIAEGLAIGIQNGAGRVDAASAALAAASIVDPATTVADPMAGTVAAYDAAYQTIATDATTTMSAKNVALTAEELAYQAASTANLSAFSATTVTGFSNLSVATQANVAAMSTGIQNTVSGMTSGVTDSFNQGHSAIASTTQLMTETATNNFQSLATNLATIMSDQIVPMFNSFDPLLQDVSGWFSTTVGNIGTTWDGLKEPVAKPSRFIINDVYNDGIRGAWNSFNSFLGLEALPEHIAKFADGGAIRGAGTGTSDSILARVANGEHVVTAREVRGAGGHAAIEAQRAAWRSGLPAFARGGPVDLNAAPWGGGGGEANLKPAAILARRNVHKYWPEIGTIGGYRAQDAYPDHPSGLALDIMTGDPIGTEVNDWLHAQKDALALNYTIWKQFYKPAGGGGNLMEDRGSPTQNHMDHVHALFNANGVAGIQDGGVGTMPMDQVVRDAINARMDAVAKRAPQFAGDIAKWVPKSIEKGRNGLLDFLVPKAAAMSKATSGSGQIGSAESWRPMAIEAMKRQGFAWQNTEQVDAMLRQIMSESSGNPAAVQSVLDVNSGGNEALGLMQITPRTWPSVRDPELPDNQFDAWASMNAGLRYYKQNYGMDLTTNWGHGHGYDQGGMLEPTPGGYGTYYNHTGKPEMVLTNSDWDAIYAAANNPVTDAMISSGVKDAIEDLLGFTPADTIAAAQETALAGANAEWVPLLLENANAAAETAKATTAAADKTATGVDRFVQVGGEISKQVGNFSAVMLALSSAIQAGADGNLTFGAVAPLLNTLGDFIEGLPDVEATYVPWAGTTQTVTEEMRRQKAINDAANFGKGLYMITKEMAPILLKQTATIGTAIEQLIAQDSAAWAQGIGLLSMGNPMGALVLIPVILKEIFTILPLIINAIMEIVPAMISALTRFFSQFMPDSVYAYDTLSAAEDAAKANDAAIKNGASAPYFVEPTKIQGSSTTNETVTLNIYGLTLPNITNGDDAEAFVSNLQVLAAN